MKKIIISYVVFLLLLCSWSRANADALGIAPLNHIPNIDGVNSAAPYQFFSQGEQIDLRDGHLTLTPAGFYTQIHGLELTVNSSFNPVRKLFGQEQYVFSRFKDDEYPNLDGNEADYVYAVPQEEDLGSFGHLSVRRFGPVSKFALSLNSDAWQFAINGIVGAISILFEPPPGSEEDPVLAYFLIKADGSTVFISDLEKGFRKNYNIVEKSNASATQVTLKDSEGNRYVFDSSDGFMSVGNQAHIQTYIEAVDCYYVWFKKTCKKYLTFEGWQVRTLFLKEVKDKFGNAISIDSIDGNNYVVRTPKTDIAVIKEDNLYKVWANYPSEEHGRVWLYELDAENRVKTLVSPAGRTTVYKYSLTGDLPQHRRIGPVFAGDPSSVVEIHYPTDGVTRYESFFDKYFKGVIVTEFPDKADASKFYQKYIIAGMSDKMGETVVYHADGTQDRYLFEDFEDVLALKKKVVSYRDKNFEIEYAWHTKKVSIDSSGENKITVINGPLSITNTVDSLGVTTSHEYDDIGRLIKTTFPEGDVTEYTYQCDSGINADNIKTVTKTKTKLNSEGVEEKNTLTLNFKPFFPFFCLGDDDVQSLTNNPTFTSSFKSAYQAKNLSEIGNLIESVRSQLEESGDSINYMPYLVGEISLSTEEGGGEKVIRKYLYNPLNGNVLHEEDGEGNGITYWYDFCSANAAQCNNLTENQHEALNELYLSTILEHKSNADLNGSTSQSNIVSVLQSLTSDSFNGSSDSLKNMLSSFLSSKMSGRSYVWDRFTDKVIRQADTDLNKMTYLYNEDGELLKIEYPFNSSYLSYEYRVAQSDGDNKIITTFHDAIRGTDYSTTQELDGLGFTEKEINSGGYSRFFSYGGHKKITAVVDSAGRMEQYSYDGLGRIENVSYPGGETTQFAYSRVGLTDTISVSSGGVDYLTYYVSPNGNIVGVDQNQCSADAGDDGAGGAGAGAGDDGGSNGGNQEGCTATFQYQYDEFDNLLKVTSPKDYKTINLYDEYSRLKGHIYPDGSRFDITSFSSTNPGLPNEIKIGKGSDASTFVIGRDSNDRLISISKSGVAEKIIEVTYDQISDPDNESVNFDGIDKPTLIKDQSGATKYYYDANGQIIGFSRKINDILGNINYSFSMLNDAFGNLYKIKYPALKESDFQNLPAGKDVPQGPEIVYDVDSAGRLKTVTDKSANRVLSSYSYNGSGELTTIVNSNGVNTTYSYYTSGRVKSIGISKDEKKLLGEEYFYDLSGNLTRVDYFDGSKIEYQYDSAGRLTKAEYLKSGDDNPYFTQNYTYDSEGNITNYSDDRQNIEYVISSGSAEVPVNAVSSIKWNEDSSISYAYNSLGNVEKETQINKGKEGAVRTYEYNDLGQLKKVTVTNPATGNKSEEEYAYDHFGRRQSKISGNSKKYYVYGGDSGPLVELDSYGVPASFHVYAGGHRIASMVDGKIVYYHPDISGNVKLLTDEDGNLIQKSFYDSYGTQTYRWGVSENRYLFAGKEKDSRTGLVYFGNGYYDPQAGRFITKNRKSKGRNFYSIMDLDTEMDYSLLNVGWSNENSGSITSISKLGRGMSTAAPVKSVLDEYNEWLNKYEGKHDYYWKKWFAPRGDNPLNKIIGSKDPYNNNPYEVRRTEIKIPYKNDDEWKMRDVSWRVGSTWEVKPIFVINPRDLFKKEFWVALKNEIERIISWAGKHILGSGPKYRKLDYTAPGFNHVSVISPWNNSLTLNMSKYEGLDVYFKLYGTQSMGAVSVLSNYNLLPGVDNVFGLGGNFGVVKRVRSPIHQFGVANGLSGSAGIFAGQLYNNVN